MSYALLNLWVRDEKCSLVNDSWRMDLVIKSCTGKYHVDMDEKTISNLQGRYPSYDIDKLPNYQGETRIKIKPPAGEHIYHLELDLVPGCWIIWARMCHGKNEETNKIMVIAQCGQEICANLILNNTHVCSANGLFPIAINAFQRNINLDWVKYGIMIMKEVGNLKKAELLNMADGRIEEIVNDGGPSNLLNANQEIRNLVDALPEDQIL